MFHQTTFHFVLNAFYTTICFVLMQKLFHFIYYGVDSFICYFFLGTDETFPYGNGYFFPVVGFCCPIPFNYLHEMLLV